MTARNLGAPVVENSTGSQKSSQRTISTPPIRSQLSQPDPNWASEYAEPSRFGLVAWPEPRILALYRVAVEAYEFEVNKRSYDPEIFRLFCRRLEASVLGEESRRNYPLLAGFRTLAALPARSAAQHYASVLAMLTHVKPAGRLQRLVNHRRPHASISTYPNSPLLCKTLISRLEFETGLINMAIHLTRLPNGGYPRIIDPSMEAGQLLVDFLAHALELLGKRNASIPEKARVAHHLARHCMYGVDRNPMALIATESVLHVLLGLHGLPRMKFPNLRTSDFLRAALPFSETRFDWVVNNPPWGEQLTPGDRAFVQSHFKTICLAPDTYIAFTDQSIRLLKEDGACGFVLPSHFLANANAGLLRELLSTQLTLKEIILLPRSEFLHATCRGAMLIGRRVGSASPTLRCHFTTFALKKRLSAGRSCCSKEIPQATLRALRGASWWPAIAGAGKSSSGPAMLALGQIAEIHCGYKRSEILPHLCAGNGQGDNMVFFAVRGVNVRDCGIRGKLEPLRVRPSAPMLRRLRIMDRGQTLFVRELVRRDGTIAAAVAREQMVPLHGVLWIRSSLVDDTELVGLLSSKFAARWAAKTLASFSKVDFQKVNVSELKTFPVPHCLLLGADSIRGRAKRQLLKQLRKLCYTIAESPVANARDTAKLHLNRVVDAIYS